MNGQHIKHRPKIAKLRADLASVIRQIRAARWKPKPTARQIIADAARRAFGGDCLTKAGSFDIENSGATIPPMSLPRLHRFTCRAFAEAYGCHPSNIKNLVRDFGAENLSDPEALFAAMVETGRSSKIRSFLTDPKQRKKAAAVLSKAAEVNRKRILHLIDRQLERSNAALERAEALRLSLPPRR